MAFDPIFLSLGRLWGPFGPLWAALGPLWTPWGVMEVALVCLGTFSFLGEKENGR